MLKNMLKLLQYLSSLLLFILVLAFLYHQYSLNKEKKFLTSSIGQRVEVDGKQMNVYVTENEPKTLILGGSVWKEEGSNWFINAPDGNNVLSITAIWPI